MEDIRLQDSNLSSEESRSIIEFLAEKRNINNHKRKLSNELLRAIKEHKSKNNKQQEITSKNKKRVGIIREELKELSYKFSKSELKEIKRKLYEIENKKKLIRIKKTNKYLDELDK